MIKLTPLITEAWDEKSIDMLLYQPNLPISYSISKKNDMITKGKAVRVLGMRGFRRLIKQQNTKAVVPAAQFWKGDDLINTGVVGGDSTVSIIGGDILYRFRYDAAVSAEKFSGRRWVNVGGAWEWKDGDVKVTAGKVADEIQELKSDVGNKFLKKYTDKSHPLLRGISINDFITPYKQKWEKDDWAESFETQWKKIGKDYEYRKIKNELIKIIIDALAKYEKTHYKDIQKIYSTPWGRDNGQHNEVEMTNFKIIKTYVKNKDFMKMLQEDFPKMKFIHEKDPSKISAMAKKDIKK